MWADDITILVEKSDGTAQTITGTGGSVTSGITGGSVSVSISERTVTLTVTPFSGYQTKKNLISVEKMVNPTDRSAARRRALNIGTFELTGPDSWVTSATEYTFTVYDDYDGAYIIAKFVSTTATTATRITSLSEITNLTVTGNYELAADIDASGSNLGEFKGTLDGKNFTIHHLSHPLFTSTDGATIRNINFENVNITTGDENGDAGAITSCAKGATRIYNCGILPTNTEYDADGNITGFLGSSVGGSGKVGGLVGLLDGSSRVINCFSYANITGGDYVGGIVGYNNVATNANSEDTEHYLKTMVMNCMFYGDIIGGSSRAPIYNGEIITNRSEDNGVSNFNYFWAGASYVQEKKIDNNRYNCALSAETRYLQRFEFFRHLLNSHRELAAWWATGNYNNKDEMAKWVMEPSQIGSSTPYPVLKEPGRYHSVVNIDNLDVANAKSRSIGKKLGTLTVYIQMDETTDNTVPFHHPGTGDDEAAITTSQLTLDITDKDPEHYNFNYYKVQLPYYNDVGTKNYTGNRVVTGWKIVSINGGSAGTFTNTGADVTFKSNGDIDKMPYNFADRHCKNKDLYSESGRVFNQGTYWDVPEGVTSITIEPYWGKAVYLADAYADVVYNKDMKGVQNVPNVGGGQKYTNRGENQFNGQTVYTALTGEDNAIDSDVLGANASHTVYDYAVVLVGNFHYNSNDYGNVAGDEKPYTVTSVDLDGDNEPDYSLILRLDGRMGFHPVRYDFLNLVGLGMAQKSTGAEGTYNLGIIQPKYWFEVTNTALFRVTQMEYDALAGTDFPIILQGGVIEQWVSGQSTLKNKVKYFHVGGNVWFKEFHLGCHQDKSDKQTKHSPVSVTGGDYGAFYLTGLYATTGNYNDNAECYINGGRFGTMAGAGMEGIGDANTHANGNIVWQIDHADIEEFYGGGINAAKPIEGNITTVISNSHVNLFCGGPKFGDMNSGRTVTTTAKYCTFGTYFGAGYGGNSYYRAAPLNFTWDRDPNWDKYNVDWDKWVKGEIKAKISENPTGNYSNGEEYEGYLQDYNSVFGGVSVGIDYQFLPQSGNTYNVARLFVDFVSFSLATTHNVKSTLTGCTVTGNFYGGGSLGKVAGNVTSTLTDCTVNGSAFGAGFSATLPTVDVMNTGGFATQPRYDKNLGAYFDGVFLGSVTYRWEHANTVNSTETAIDKTNHILYTTEDLTTLGTVTGNVTINIKGNTEVFGSVYGGGDQGVVNGSTQVNIQTGE